MQQEMSSKIADVQEISVSEVAATLSKAQFLAPLRILCVRKVAESLLHYVNHGMETLSSSLPAALCEDVFDEVVRVSEMAANKNCLHSAAKKWRRLSFAERVQVARLFSVGSRKFCCSLLLMDTADLQKEKDDDQDDYLLEGTLLTRLVRNSSDKLVVFRDNRPYEGPLLRASAFLGFMSSLVKLEIEQQACRDFDLRKIGTCLPRLKHLGLLLHNKLVTKSGLKCLANLKNLQTLVLHHLDSPSRGEVEAAVNNFCLQLMPYLKIAGVRAQAEKSIVVYGHDLGIFKEPIELGLEHLVVDNLQIPDTVSLPHLSHLTVSKVSTASDPEPFTSLKKLSHLFLGIIMYPNLKPILAQNGQRLSQLSIAFCGDTLDLMDVLRSCPNLTLFSLQHGVVRDNLDASKLRKCVQHLQTFELLLRSSVESRGLLHLLLSECPQLHALTLNNVLVGVNEFQKASDSLRTVSSAATHIRKVVLGRCFRASDALQLEAYVNFVHVLFAQCPDIVNTFPTHPLAKERLRPLKKLLRRFGRHTTSKKVTLVLQV